MANTITTATSPVKSSTSFPPSSIPADADWFDLALNLRNALLHVTDSRFDSVQSGVEAHVVLSRRVAEAVELFAQRGDGGSRLLGDLEAIPAPDLFQFSLVEGPH